MSGSGHLTESPLKNEKNADLAVGCSAFLLLRSAILNPRQLSLCHIVYPWNIHGKSLFDKFTVFDVLYEVQIIL